MRKMSNKKYGILNGCPTGVSQRKFARRRSFLRDLLSTYYPSGHRNPEDDRVGLKI